MMKIMVLFIALVQMVSPFILSNLLEKRHQC